MRAAPEHRTHADLLVVGGGPSAMRALADLETALVATAGDDPYGSTPTVVVVDPADAGGGAVWRVDQPPFLTMNVAATAVDLRCPSVAWDLRQWHDRTIGHPCPRYPARAVVGRYLRWVWQQLERSPWFDLVHRRGTVTAIGRTVDAWSCRIGGTDAVVADRVLLATGHRTPLPFDPATLMQDAAPYEAGSTVLVRGAALTAFDAVLCLTAGRGGRWRPVSSGVSEYLTSGREPRRVVLVSRSGRMMLPKPVEPSTAMLAAVESLRPRWTQVEPLTDPWWEVLVDAAGAAAATHDVALDPATARAWLDDPPSSTGTDAVATRWRADLARARGTVDDDPAWWLGRAWSAAYPDLLASLERLPRKRSTWTRFRRRAATLERWTFGPPAELVERLLALIEADRLELATADRAPVASPTDVIAHIPGPGVLPRPRPWEEDEPGRVRPSDARSPLWAGLLEAGHVQVRPGEPGVLTTATGTCLGDGGRPSLGLGAVGRPTEGPVVDHDSLQRRLHLDTLRWAEATAHDLRLRLPSRPRERQESIS